VYLTQGTVAVLSSLMLFGEDTNACGRAEADTDAWKMADGDEAFFSEAGNGWNSPLGNFGAGEEDGLDGLVWITLRKFVTRFPDSV
jgi:hypothetical protein